MDSKESLMKHKDLYSVLGCVATATLTEIKKGRKEQVLIWHPGSRSLSLSFCLSIYLLIFAGMLFFFLLHQTSIKVTRARLRFVFN